MADNLEFKGNGSQLLKEIEKMIEQWQKYGSAIEKTEAVTVKANKTGENTVRTLKTVNKEGATTVTTQKKVGDAWEDQTVKITKNTAALEKQKSATKAAAAAARSAAATAKRERAVGAFVTQRAGVGLEDSRATQEERTGVVAAANQANKYLRQQKVTLKEVQRIWNDLERGEVKRYGERLGGVQTRLQKMRTAQANLGRQTRSDLKKTQDALDRQHGASNRAWKSIAKLFTVHLAHRAISALTRALTEGIKEAVRLQKAIAEVQTISQKGAKTTEQWFEEAEKLSSAFGVDIADQLEGIYQALSNQIVDASNATEFLAEANQFAAVSVSTTADSVALLSSVLNSYDKDAAEATDISAKLFKTIELGRVRSSEMANSLGDVTVVANKLGIELSEVLASVTTLTRQGVKYNKVATQLRGIMLKLLKPTNEMKGLFNDLGVESGKAAIEAYGFIGFLEELEKATNGSATEMAKFIPRARGMTGVLGLTGKNLQALKKDFQEIENATDSYGNAIETTFENSGKTAEVASGRISNWFKEHNNTILDTYAKLYRDMTTLDDAAASERADLLNQTDVKKNFDDITRDFENSQKDQQRIFKREQANYLAGVNRQVALSKQAYEEISLAAQISNATLTRQIDANVSRLSGRISSLTREIADANQYVIDIAKEESQLIFDWAQESRSMPQQIEAINKRISKIQNEKRKAFLTDDLDAVKKLGDEELKLLKQRRSIGKAIEKENKEAVKKRLELEKQINAIKAQGKKGDQVALAKLKAEQAEIVLLNKEQLNDVGAVTKLINEQIKLVKNLAEAKKKSLKDAEAELFIREIQRDELKALIADYGKTSLKGILGAGDAGQILAELEKRIALFEKITEKSKVFGVDPAALVGTKEQAKLEAEIVKLKTDALKTTEKETKLFKGQTEERKKATEAAIKEAEELATQQSKLEAARSTVLEATQKDFQKAASQGFSLTFTGAMQDVLRGTALQQTIQEAVAGGRQVKGNIVEALGVNELSLAILDYSIALEQTRKAKDAVILSNTEIEQVKEQILRDRKAAEEKDQALKDELKRKTELLEIEKTRDLRLEKEQAGIQNINNGLAEQLRLTKEIQATQAAPLQTGLTALNVAGATPTGSVQNITSRDTYEITMNTTGSLQYDAAQLANEIKKLQRRGVVA